MINTKIYELAERMMSGYNSSAKFVHNPTKGEAREDLLIEYLERLLPIVLGFLNLIEKEVKNKPVFQSRVSYVRLK